MQDILLWHDSEVLRVTVSGKIIEMVMSAAAVERLGPEGKLSGFIKPVTLRCHGARLSGSDVADCIGVIAQGEWRAVSAAGEGALQRQLPLPWAHHGTVRLSLHWRNGSHLLIDADAAECRPDGDARFMASYAC